MVTFMCVFRISAACLVLTGVNAPSPPLFTKSGARSAVTQWGDVGLMIVSISAELEGNH